MKERDKAGGVLGLEEKSLCFKPWDGWRRLLLAPMGLAGKERIPLVCIAASISLSLGKYTERNVRGDDDDDKRRR